MYCCRSCKARCGPPLLVRYGAIEMTDTIIMINIIIINQLRVMLLP